MTDGPVRNPTGLSRAEFLALLGGSAAALGLRPLSGAAEGVGRIIRRSIPSTGEALPIVGLGTARVFDAGASEKDRAPRREVLRLLLEAGGKVVDTAPSYGGAETLVGDLLADLDARDRTFLATKVGANGKEAGLRQMTESLKRLGTDKVDLMQVHNLRDWRVQLASLRAWKREGRIRYLGVTHSWAARNQDLADIVKTQRLDFVQTIYNIGTRDAEKRLLPTCADKGVAVLVNLPFERGRFFRAVGDRPLPQWAAEFGAATWGQFFLKFILGHPAVTCVIPGTRKPEHMLDNAAAGMGRLPDQSQRRRMAAFMDDL